MEDDLEKAEDQLLQLRKVKDEKSDILEETERLVMICCGQVIGSGGEGVYLSQWFMRRKERARRRK